MGKRGYIYICNKADSKRAGTKNGFLYYILGEVIIIINKRIRTINEVTCKKGLTYNNVTNLC